MQTSLIIISHSNCEVCGGGASILAICAGCGMHVIVLDGSLDHLIEIQKYFASFTFTSTVFPHPRLSLVHTHAHTPS